MATNNIAALPENEGSYSFFLNAQGRIQGDGYIFRQGDSLLLETTTQQREKLIPILDHFIIMDDVELAPAMEDQTGLTLIGPQSTELLDSLNLTPPAPIALLQTTWSGEPLLLIAAYSPLVSRYELWAAPAAIAALETSLQAAGTLPLDSETLETLRVLEGAPLYGQDIRDRDLPQETAQDRALHFTKGCYLGQEIVERIRSRGQVHRTFTGFNLTGAPPLLPAPLEADGKPVGDLTSAVSLPSGQVLALGYVRREALGLPLRYPGGQATPATLPFSNL